MNTLSKAVVAAAAMTLFTAGGAHALPPGGASADTPGTSASVSPATIAPGGTLSFSIAGFPAGETVSVKIDDGEFCSQKGVHGACVVHQQKTDSQGRARGSFVLPADLSAGKHWLRFLASAEILDADGRYLGVKPYSLRGNSDFTVASATTSRPGGATEPGAGPTKDAQGSDRPGTSVAPQAQSAPGTTPGGSTATPGAQQGNADAGTAGDAPVAANALRVPAIATSATAEGSQETGGDSAAGAQEAQTRAEEASSSDEAMRVPWFGGAAVVLVALVAGAVLFRRRAGA